MKSINTILKDTNCKIIDASIITNTYKFENYFSYDSSYKGIIGLVLAQKEYKTVSSNIINKNIFHLSKIVFSKYDDDKLKYKFIIHRSCDCISNFKIKLYDKNKNNIDLSNYIDKIYLLIGNDIIYSEIKEDLFSHNICSINHPIPLLGHCKLITLNIEFNETIIDDSNINIELSYLEMFMSNNVRKDISVNGTIYNYHDKLIKFTCENCSECKCINYIKKPKLLNDYYDLFSKRTIEDYFDSYIIILFYSAKDYITINLNYPYKKINFISIYYNDKCDIDFNKYFTFKITHNNVFTYKFHSQSLYNEFVKCNSKILYLIYNI